MEHKANPVEQNGGDKYSRGNQHHPERKAREGRGHELKRPGLGPEMESGLEPELGSGSEEEPGFYRWYYDDGKAEERGSIRCYLWW